MRDCEGNTHTIMVFNNYGMGLITLLNHLSLSFLPPPPCLSLSPYPLSLSPLSLPNHFPSPYPLSLSPLPPFPLPSLSSYPFPSPPYPLSLSLPTHFPSPPYPLSLSPSLSLPPFPLPPLSPYPLSLSPYPLSLSLPTFSLPPHLSLSLIKMINVVKSAISHIV